MTSMLEGERGVLKKWTNADRGEGGFEPTRTSMKMTNFDSLTKRWPPQEYKRCILTFSFISKDEILPALWTLLS